MLYDNNKKQKRLSDELFKSPGKEYRAAPFWAWNSKLEAEELGLRATATGLAIPCGASARWSNKK